MDPQHDSRETRPADEAGIVDGVRFSSIDRLLPSAASAIAILVLWLPYLRSSFWLDETGTAWIVSGGIGQVISRSNLAGLVGQSPAYYILAWFARSAFGSSEVALRLPSLLAAAATVWVVYRIGVRLFDRTAASLAAVTFSTLICIAFAAVDARPYAVALFAYSLATLALVRWQEEHSHPDAVAYVVLSTFTIYLTYMFAVGLLAHGIYAYYKARRGGVRLPRFFLAWISIAILTVPTLPRLYRTLTAPAILRVGVKSQRDEYLFLSQIVLPIVVALLLAILALRIAKGQRKQIRSTPYAGVLVGALTVAAPVTFWVLSYAVAPKFFTHRYFLTFAVGIALAAGRFLATIPIRQRYLGVGVMLLIPLLGYHGDVHRQDWRGAARLISARGSSETPILLSAFAVEPRNYPTGQGFLRAPLTSYDAEGRIILLPPDLNAEDISRLRAIVTRELLPSHRFFLVTGFNPPPFRVWLDRALAGKGFKSQTIFAPPGLQLVEFDRDSR